MDLALFGATGRTGRQVTSLALARGHTVRALVRRTGALDEVGRVDEVVGHVLDGAAVAGTIAGADAVISTLGGGPLDAPGVTLSQGMRTIVAGMRHQHVSRVLAVASSGVLDAPGGGLRVDQPSFPEMFRGITQEHLGTWAALRDSGLAWTLACPPDLVDEEPTGHRRACRDQLPDNADRIAIGDLAAFLLDELVDRRFVDTRVGVSW